MSYELIAILIFSTMMLMLLTGQRVFGAIGGVATLFALLLWGKGAAEMPFNAAFSLLNWYPLLTLPMFIYMGYMFSESGIASDLYHMFHVWMGPIHGGLAIGTIGLMTAVAAMIGAFFILDDPIFRGLAIALIFGLLISTLLTLVVIPLLLYSFRYGKAS